MDTQNQREQSYEKQNRLSQFITSQFLKRVVTKLLVSVSVFSLVFSHPTLISFLHYFNFYFSTLPFKLFSHTLDKNWTFLLCNGLLVFLAKYSGLFSLSSSPSNNNKFNLTVDHHASFKNYEDDSQPQITIMETTTDDVPIMLEQEAELESTQTQQQKNAMQPEIENIESEAAKTETEAEGTHEEQEKEAAEEESAVLEEEAEEESSFFIEEVEEEEEEEEEVEEEGNGKLSDEELNKKFEDFIRKMKEELRIEARQQLIMV